MELSYDTEGWDEIPAPQNELWGEEERKNFVSNFWSYHRIPSSWDSSLNTDMAYKSCQYLVEDLIPQLNKVLENGGNIVEITSLLKDTRRIVYEHLMLNFSIAIEDIGAVDWEENEETGERKSKLLLWSRGE